MHSALAIIVPAYKARFLARTLTSLGPEVSSAARLYVFDDASPEAVPEVVKATLQGAPFSWQYTRFDQNLGGSALTQHYDRCVRQTKEPWIWLFSDDDLVEPGCAQSFLDTVTATRGAYDVYCFDSCGIDADDRVSTLHPPLPETESWKHFAYWFFCGHRAVPQQAIVFSRAAYERVDGFVRFPMGWASDQATLMAMAARSGIRRIPGAKVRFRYSGENISSRDDRALASKKHKAAMAFVDWVITQINRVPDPEFALDDALLRRRAFQWFHTHLAALHMWYGPTQCVDTARFLSRSGADSYPKALARMLALDASKLSQSLRLHLLQPAR